MQLFLFSFTALFFQIALIRWIPAQVQLVAYFTNLILLGSFFGLGLGCFLARRAARLSLFFLPTLLILTLAASGISRWPLGDLRGGGSERFAGLLVGGPLSFLIPLMAIFLLVVATFIPLGQGIGRGFSLLPPLRAYLINLGGSLAGLLTYGLMTSFYTEPFHWFLLGGIVFLAAARLPFRQTLFAGAMGCLLLWQVGPGHDTASWSPYYRLSVRPLIGMATGQRVGFDLLANQTGFARAVDLSDHMVSQEPRLKGARTLYDLPYRFIRPKSVLILGSGPGNDVAAALRAGVIQVDAVEIDPLVITLGEGGHPENPFHHPAVHLHEADGRAFIDRTAASYDLIVLGFLDSQRLFSQFSSVRQDNFMYTLQCFKRLRRMLSPEGMLCVSYTTTFDWMGKRISTMLAQVFQEPPAAYQGASYHPDDTVVFLSGPAAPKAPLPAIEECRPTDRYRSREDPATDDWPYLYIRSRSLPPHYLAMIAAVLTASVLLFATFFPGAARPDFPLFFMGAAFLLIETKSITRLALLFGSTWTVNLWVISMVFLMAMGSAWLAGRLKSPLLWRWFLALEAAVALDGWVTPSAVGQAFGSEIGRFIAGGLAGLPLLFSGVLFALLFKRSEDPQTAFGWNLLGAMVGGLLEYLSLAVGFRALSVVVAFLYALAFATRGLIIK